MPAQFPDETSKEGEFVRQQYVFRNRITADGSSGFPAVAGRYHLYVSMACPWAHRSIIVRKLLGLEDTLSMTIVDPVRDHHGWEIAEGPGNTPDPVNGFRYLSEAYLRTDPNYRGRYTVPALWDRKTGRLLSNNFPDLTVDMETQFTAFHHPGAPELYPARLREEIDGVNQRVYADVNNGVYRAGFATSQKAYDGAVERLFAALDWLESRLTAQRYLVGNQLTEADIRLFTTLVRFDSVYHYHFKCNLRRLTDYPALWAYTRDLFQRPAFGETVDFSHIKRHYYLTHPEINPSRLIPQGPILDWAEPHGREALGPD